MECPPNLNWKDQIHLLSVKPKKYFSLCTWVHITKMMLVRIAANQKSLAIVITLHIFLKYHSRTFVTVFYRN